MLTIHHSRPESLRLIWSMLREWIRSLSSEGLATPHWLPDQILRSTSVCPNINSFSTPVHSSLLSPCLYPHSPISTTSLASTSFGFNNPYQPPLFEFKTSCSLSFFSHQLCSSSLQPFIIFFRALDSVSLLRKFHSVRHSHFQFALFRFRSWLSVPSAISEVKSQILTAFVNFSS